MLRPNGGHVVVALGGTREVSPVQSTNRNRRRKLARFLEDPAALAWPVNCHRLVHATELQQQTTELQQQTTEVDLTNQVNSTGCDLALAHNVPY